MVNMMGRILLLLGVSLAWGAISDALEIETLVYAIVAIPLVIGLSFVLFTNKSPEEKSDKELKSNG